MRETDCNLLFQNELKDIAKIIEEIKEQYTSEFETCSYEVKNLGGNWILKKYIFAFITHIPSSLVFISEIILFSLIPPFFLNSVTLVLKHFYF